MGFTPRKPARPQTKVVIEKPKLTPGVLQKEIERRWLFQTCDKSPGSYTVPQLKEQLEIDNGDWKNIIDKVHPLFEGSYGR